MPLSVKVMDTVVVVSSLSDEEPEEPEALDDPDVVVALVVESVDAVVVPVASEEDAVVGDVVVVVEDTSWPSASKLALSVTLPPSGPFRVMELVTLPSEAVRTVPVSSTLPSASVSVSVSLKPSSVFSPVMVRVEMLPDASVMAMVVV